MTNKQSTLLLPARRDLAPVRIASLIIAFAMSGASIAGLLFQSEIYPTEELRNAFVPNDCINLFIGLPILLVSLWLAHRGRLVGLLLWPGALFYVLYNYLIYLLAMPMNIFLLVIFALVMLSIYTIFQLFTIIDMEKVRLRLAQAVPERFAGGVLAGLSALFLVMAIVEMISPIFSQEELTRVNLALHITDILFSLAWIVGGIALWRGQRIGYTAGLGLLFQFSMLFVGLIVFMLLQPYLSGLSSGLADYIFILATGMICFIPFVLFMRGVLSKE